MAQAIVSGNKNPTALMVPLVVDDCSVLQGLVTIDVHATMPEFDISTGDFMRVDFDCKRVTADGLYVAAENEWTGVRRFQRVPIPLSPTGLKIKVDCDTRWEDATFEMLDTLKIIGRVLRVFRSEMVS